MPRPRRVHVQGGLSQSVLGGNHRQAIFDRTIDCLDFEGLLAEALTRYDATAVAYCRMTNHVHLAIRVGAAPPEPFPRAHRGRSARVSVEQSSSIPRAARLG